MAHIRPSEPSDQPSMLSTFLLSNQLNPTASTQTSNCHISEQQHQRLLQKHGVRSPLQPPLQHPDDQPTLWVFGYGSLLWKTDFAYRSKQIGYIKGYERRFYLGNTTFRGRPGQPGRVANLVEVENGKTWGVAFEVHGREEVAKVLKNLFAREVVSGGYLVMSTSFFPRETCHLRRDSVAESSTDSLSSLADENEISLEQSNTTSRDIEFLSPEATNPIEVILFTVTDNNELYLGPDTMDNMAKQIVKSKGSAGSNVEYVTKTADFVRAHIPEDEDRHLFQLDAKVRELVYQAQTHDVERVRLGLSDISHDLDAYHDRPQAAIVRAS